MSRPTSDWYVALRSIPGDRVVRVRVRRRWYLPVAGRVELEPIGPDGPAWLPVVEWCLTDAWPPGPRGWMVARAAMARRVEGALRQMAATTPALTYYPASAVPPTVPAPGPRAPEGAIPSEWLRWPLEAEEADRALVERPELAGARHPGDEIWWFESPPASWEARAGRSGYAIVRRGVAVHAVPTRIN